MTKKTVIILVVAAVLLKISLFSFAVFKAPEAKIRNDTSTYIKSGLMLVSKGVFGMVSDNGVVSYELYRTPGYPLFLGILHGPLKVPLNGIVFIQILLTIFSAIIVCMAANKIDPHLGWGAFFIMLFDPSITVFSMMLLTETLFLLFLSVFIYAFVVYLQERKKSYLILSALVLAAATYIRPISFYLGWPLAGFVLYAVGPKDFKKGIVCACMFILVVHSLLFLWQWRNYRHYQEFRFSSIEDATVHHEGLYKSYVRNQDPDTQGAPPLYYYTNVSTRCMLSLFTRPVSLKYFRSDTLKKAGKLLSYPWILFWLTGFFFGIYRMGRNVSFHFLLLIILYFSAATVVGAMWGADARFRVPMMPCIAIISSYGWGQLMRYRR